ncbi:tyrosine-type recombinase/integrase [Rhizobium giardinii]|uniref:Integrase n=1 Tax=Rhizobium giardinii TaxID=56731 RepID=A0A7W8UCF5_9HYPH|nr:integrase arm-type DNA-binding domain-containing protein [Rhizobium giardinii]MBB5536845.1 integrase [Rhizobium giardinii]
MTLTARQVETIRKPGRHADGDNLYLRVSERDGRVSKSWVFMWKRDGRQREIGLGSAATVSLKTARELAKATHDKIAKGTDPLKEKRAEKATFSKIAGQCIESLRDTWATAKTADSWRYHLTHHAGSLGDKAVRDIDTADILGVLKPLWGRKIDTADKLRARIARVLDFAKAHGLRPADSQNPAAWDGHLENILRPQEGDTKHHPAVPYADMPAFVTRLSAMPGFSYRGLELLALTATRYSQVHRAEWAEFDFENRLWTIPAARCKKRKGMVRKAHVVPLSDAALAVLKRIRAELSDVAGKKLFPGMGKERMRKDLVVLTDGKYVPHGFRSSFSDWAADRTAFPDWLVEECLDHLVGTAVRRAYRRGAQDFSKREKVFAAWGGYLTRSAANDKVTALRAVQ